MALGALMARVYITDSVIGRRFTLLITKDLQALFIGPVSPCVFNGLYTILRWFETGRIERGKPSGPGMKPRPEGVRRHGYVLTLRLVLITWYFPIQ